MKTIEFIGGGRITKIILRAFENVGIAFEKLSVFDVNADTLQAINVKYPYVNVSDNMEESGKSDLVILAVHPPIVMEVLDKIKANLQANAVIMSFSPKFTIEKISEVLGGHKNTARMNPSASSIVNRGVNPIAFATSFDPIKKAEMLELFKSLGSTPEVADSKIEAYAVISAMGHTYFNFQLQKLKELAVSFGMDEAEAKSTISNMLWGTTETLFNSGLSYAEVADLVPLKPMGEVEGTIKDYYDIYLNAIYNKIKPQYN